MFRKLTGGKDDKDMRGEKNIIAPPLKPFSKRGSHNPVKMPSAHSPGPAVASHGVDIPSAPRISEHRRFADNDSKCLIVGRDICLSGEITSCDRLVVEGDVEVTLDASEVEVTASGHFKGEARVETADISGRFDGKLIARGKLTVRAGGRVCGTIRYGGIVIESGGEISGDTKSLGDGDTSGEADNEAKDEGELTADKS